MDLWVFDNDGTLYDDKVAHSEFAKHLASYLVNRLGVLDADVEIVGKRLRTKHKTSSTVVAVVREFGLDIKEVIKHTYLRIDLDLCQIPKEDAEHEKALAQIKGRKVILTNNPSVFAQRIIEWIGLRQYFDDIVGMEEMAFVLKPDPRAFLTVMRRHPDATRIFLCDDLLENLDAAAALGWKTVWYQPDRNIDQGNRTHFIAHSFEEVTRIAVLM